MSCRLARFFLDVSEELEKVLSVFLERLLGADETKLAHFVEVGEALDLFVLLLKKHLDEEHLSLLFDQILTIFSVFGRSTGTLKPAFFATLILSVMSGLMARVAGSISVSQSLRRQTSLVGLFFPQI